MKDDMDDRTDFSPGNLDVARRIARIIQIRNNPDIPKFPAPTMFDAALDLLWMICDLPPDFASAGVHSPLDPPIEFARYEEWRNFLRHLENVLTYRDPDAVAAARDLALDRETETLFEILEDLLQSLDGAIEMAEVSHEHRAMLDRQRNVWVSDLGQLRLTRQVQRAAETTLRELDDTRRQNAELKEVVKVGREGAGEVGALELASYFERMAEVELKSADYFRRAAVSLFFVLTIGVLLWALFVPSDVATVIAHLGVAAAGAGTASYLASEAGKHRRAARWANANTVQLRTISLYCAPLDAEITAYIMKLLATRIFGAMPGETEISDGATSAPLAMDALTGLPRGRGSE